MGRHRRISNKGVEMATEVKQWYRSGTTSGM